MLLRPPAGAQEEGRGGSPQEGGRGGTPHEAAELKLSSNQPYDPSCQKTLGGGTFCESSSPPPDRTPPRVGYRPGGQEGFSSPPPDRTPPRVDYRPGGREGSTKGKFGIPVKL